jgi:hypothetical protein
MLPKQRETLFHMLFYALFAFVVLVIGKAAWLEYTTSTYGFCDTPMVLDRPFASSATLHLPFTALSPQVLRLGTDALSLTIPASSGSSRIGKCTVMHGNYELDYTSAFGTHHRHSEIHRYPIFVLDRPVVDGLWSKEAALLAVLSHEMSKAEGDRLHWLMWFDANTLVINPLIAVENFLPPHNLDGINLVVTEDWNGLNNGVLLIRVAAWSVDLLANILAYPTYGPDADLPSTEQSAMEPMIQDPRYASGCIYVPPRWFNSYPRDEDEAWTKYHVERGDMMLHFPDVGDRSRMVHAFHSRVMSERDKWEIPVTETNLLRDTADFWRNVGMQRKQS